VNSNGYWKWTSGIMASVLFTGLVAWFTFGRDTASQMEVAQLRSQMQSDNRRLEDALSNIRSSVDEMRGTLRLWLRSQEQEREKLPR